MHASHAESPTPPTALRPAEQIVLQAASTGGEAFGGVGVSLNDPLLVVDAGFLRDLATGKFAAWPVHQRGILLRRLRVVGKLDLSECEVRWPLRFTDCQLDVVSLTGATLPTLSFVGGSVEAIEGDRVKAAALFLRGVTVHGGTRFLGAQVAGDIDCGSAQLFTPVPDLKKPDSNLVRRDIALGLDGATIGGAFFLRRAVLHGSISASSLVVGKVLDARELVVDGGGVDLSDAAIGGDADFDAAQITDAPGENGLVLSQARIGRTVHLTGTFQTNRCVALGDARIAGNLSLRGAHLIAAIPFVVSAQRLQVDGTFDLDSTTCFGLDDLKAAQARRVAPTSRLAPRRGAKAPRAVRATGSAFDLSAALVGSLSDQYADWPRGNRVLGFRYKEIVGATSTRAVRWVDWLRLQGEDDLRVVEGDTPEALASGFRPQPWDQAILALRGAGCSRDAEDVAIAKEREAHRHGMGLAHQVHRLWGFAAAYGYRPLRLLWALPAIYAISVLVFLGAAAHGAMAPTEDKVLTSAEFQRCHPEHGGNWARCALAPAYPDFNAAAYALQTLFPAIEARQSRDWAPQPWLRPVVRLPTAPLSTAASATSSASAVGVVWPTREAEAQPPASWWGLGALWWGWIEATFGLAAPLLVGLVWSGLIVRKPRE